MWVCRLSGPQWARSCLKDHRQAESSQPETSRSLAVLLSSFLVRRGECCLITNVSCLVPRAGMDPANECDQTITPTRCQLDAEVASPTWLPYGDVARGGFLKRSCSLGGRHHVCCNRSRLAVPGRGYGPGELSDRGLVDVRDDRCETGLCGTEIGLRAANAWPWTTGHTDRGSQYASHDYRKLAEDFAITTSMSRKAGCWDTRAQARLDIADWIEDFYNRVRMHTVIG